jgi:hypothetical protein
MEFRRTGHRDERRRRVLIDELITSPPSSESDFAVARGSSAEQPPRRYSTAVITQPGITCLVPTRGWTLSVLFLGGLALIGGLLSLHAAVYPQLVQHRVAWVALDLTARGSLASWFGGTIYLLGSGSCAMLFWLRSHKLDDYRGHYRLWLLTTILALVASCDLVTGLHRAFGEVLVELAQGRLGGDAASWTAVGLALIGGTWAARIALEVRVSRAALLFLSASGACFSITLSLAWGWLPVETPVIADLIGSAGWLVGAWMLLFAVLTYCRFVLLDAQGLVPHRQSEPSAVKERSRWGWRRRKPPSDETDSTGGEESESELASSGSPMRRTRTTGSVAKRKPRKKAESTTKSSRVIRKGSDGNLRVDAAHSEQTDDTSEQPESASASRPPAPSRPTEVAKPMTAAFSAAPASVAKPTPAPTAAKPIASTSTSSATKASSPSISGTAPTHSTPTASTPVKPVVLTKPAAPSHDEDDDESDDESGSAKGMSKAERRRLRKQQRRGTREEVET